MDDSGLLHRAGITGLNITFGKTLLLPLIGLEAFAAFSQWGKYAHNYLSFPFTLGVLFIFLHLARSDNIPDKVDVEWLKAGGGLVGRPILRPNASMPVKKVIYWVVVFGGTAVAVSGYLLMFPFYETGIRGMQTSEVVHGVVAMLFVAAMLAHIYIGTVGMEGAFDAMGTGGGRPQLGEGAPQPLGRGRGCQGTCEHTACARQNRSGRMSRQATGWQRQIRTPEVVNADAAGF